MSLAITHFAVGAGTVLLVQSLFFPDVRFPRVLVILGGLWALVPDLHYVLSSVDPLLVGREFRALSNVFWFHPVLDGLHPGRGTRGGAALGLGYLLCCGIVADLSARWR